MAERKTLGYDWEYGHEELILQVAAYADRNRLYIGLRDSKSGEDFSDLTINLPHEYVGYAEAYINDFAGTDILFIEHHELGKVLQGYGHVDFGTYRKVLFDLERLAEFDPEGVKNYRKLHEDGKGRV